MKRILKIYCYSMIYRKKLFRFNNCVKKYHSQKIKHDLNWKKQPTGAMNNMSELRSKLDSFTEVLNKEVNKFKTD